VDVEKEAELAGRHDDADVIPPRPPMYKLATPKPVLWILF
jgi:hypothetical protein